MKKLYIPLGNLIYLTEEDCPLKLSFYLFVSLEFKSNISHHQHPNVTELFIM